MRCRALSLCWLLIILFAAAPSLTACGQKGPLYLPDQPQEKPDKKQR